jgi:rhodanese-related sulfurtransferase
MDKRAYKDAIYTELSRIGKAISSPKRLEMLDLLCQRAWTVEELANETHITLANASQHLQVLRSAQLVETVKRGLFVEYRVANENVCTACHAIRSLAERQLAEIERITSRFIDGREEFVSIDRDTLLKGLDDGSITLVDVRPESEYRNGHLAGAINIPVDNLSERLRDLKRDQRIVAYCRGPYCLFASDAVRLLQSEGYEAIRYEEGVADWQAAGLPVVSGTDGSTALTAEIAEPRAARTPRRRAASAEPATVVKKTGRRKS